MSEEHQQQRSEQPNGQRQQPQGQPPVEQSSQGGARRSGGQASALTRRGMGMPSVFTIDPFDMVRTSPFALMRRFTEEMDQHFAQFRMGQSGHAMPEAGSGLFSPPLEVFERDGALVVRADLPGLTKDDVHVEVNDNALLIEGERRSEHEERQSGVFRSERHYGKFHRQIPLPEGVNADQVTASFKDGVLEVAMPAPQRQVRGRRIDIQSGTPSGKDFQASSSSGPQEAGSPGSPGASSTGQARAQTPTSAGRS